MRLVVWVTLLASLGAAQQLHVTSADIRSVKLEWTGSAPEWTVERTSGNAPFQKIGTATAGSFEDGKIDPYGTYRYRVSAAGAKPSNETPAGPPPMGVQAAAPAPKTGEPGAYGVNSAMTRDENGDPAIVFVSQDPNADGELSDTEVDFARWDRAAYTWRKPVKIATVGDLPSKNVEPLSVACDARTGVFVVAMPVHGSGLNVGISRDRGATWTLALVQSTEAPVASTAVALAGETIHLAWPLEGAGVEYRTGSLADEPSKWQKQTSPSAPGWKSPNSTNVALVMDAAGKPVIAYYSEQDDGSGRRMMAWRPGAAPVAAFESKATTDFPNLALTTGGGRIGMLVSNPTDPDKSDYSISYVSSTDGTAWTKPSVVPPDGPRSTNHPQDAAIDSKGRVFAVFGSNSGSEGPKCGAPVMSRSADGTKWATCGFAKAAGQDYEVQPSTIHVMASGDDSVYVTWNQATDGTTPGRGVLVWHGR